MSIMCNLGMVSEDAQSLSFSRDRQTETEMTTCGTATRRQKNRIVYIVGDSILKAQTFHSQDPQFTAQNDKEVKEL